MSYDLIKAEREKLKTPKDPDYPSYETSGNERLPGLASEWVLFPWILGILFAAVWLARIQG